MRLTPIRTSGKVPAPMICADDRKVCMEKKPVVLWQDGAVACVVTQHWKAQSYEIQVLADGRVIERRWFVTDVEAAAFASAYRQSPPHAVLVHRQQSEAGGEVRCTSGEDAICCAASTFALR